MATFEDFVVDAKAIKEGAWVRVDPTYYDDLEIQSRGFTDEFSDAQNAAKEKLTRKYGSVIPNEESRALNAQLLRDHLILGVRNLMRRDGSTVELPDFLDILDKREGAKLAAACWLAVGKVSTAAQGELADVEGNSALSSATSSSGEATNISS